jgi:hypothetical protein
MRYIVGLLLGIGLIILTFILIFKAFSGGSHTPKTNPIDLNSYSTTDAVMRMTIDGPITSEQKHSVVRVTVGNDQVLFEQLDGYQGKLVQSKTYPSNPDAYATFLRALTLADYTKGNPNGIKDERGYCPNGRRYVYEALTRGDTILRWWSDTCNSKGATFLGNRAVVQRLFTDQVPDYSKLVSKARL